MDAYFTIVIVVVTTCYCYFMNYLSYLVCADLMDFYSYPFIYNFSPHSYALSFIYRGYYPYITIAITTITIVVAFTY